MNRKRTLLATCIWVCWAGSVLGQSLPKSKRPEDVDFSSERLARITKFFQGDIDKGAIPGATLLVTREGKLVYFQALGYQDREKSIPMKPEAIFRIASMTKPITSVAVMMLAEEGKIDLLAPVSQYLPEFCAGAYGTYFWVDPQAKIFAVMMVQMPFPQSGYYRRAFRELVYGALLR